MDEPKKQLILYIQNSRPIPSADLGRLFASMALDYRKATGRELVVAKIEGGSIFVYLQEAASHFNDVAEFADAANHIFDFAKNIAGIVLLSLGGFAAAKKVFGKGGENGWRTVESIAKLAVKSGANVKLLQSKTGNPILTISPAEAKQVQKFASKNKKLKMDPHQKTDALKFDVGMRAAIVDAVKRGDDVSKRLIAAFVEMLKKKSMEYLLLELADELEQEGLFEAASLVREAHGGKKSQGQIPSLGN